MPWYPISGQQDDDQASIDSMGSVLSLKLGCPIRYCAYQYGKPVFECWCNIIFPVFMVKPALENNKWEAVYLKNTFGELVSSKMITAGKNHKCNGCSHDIVKDERMANVIFANNGIKTVTVWCLRCVAFLNALGEEPIDSVPMFGTGELITMPGYPKICVRCGREYTNPVPPIKKREPFMHTEIFSNEWCANCNRVAMSAAGRNNSVYFDPQMPFGGLDSETQNKGTPVN